MQGRAIDAVIFDLGGVVLDSPLAVFLDYERELGLAPKTLGRAVVAAGSDGAWARLERGELAMADFFAVFDAELLAQGIAISAATLMAKIAERTDVRPEMVAAIRKLRAAGLHTAALTNNWVSDDQDHKMRALQQEFNVFVESVRVGWRKPDPRIYRHVCDLLGAKPERVVFLDDIGANLKAARALGMTTIKVDEPRAALRELGNVVGLELLA